MDFDYDYKGNLSLLDRPTVAFFASRIVPPELFKRTMQWVDACCRTDRIVISGFQSPLEKAVLERLLEARHPVIWALGRSLYRHYALPIEAALSEGRILIFAAGNGCRTGWRSAQARNFAIASMTDESVYAINDHGRRSSLGVLYELESMSKPVTALSHECRSST